MSRTKVLFINPNPRQMSLVSPVVSLFYSIFKTNGIDMEFFDTTFYDVSDKYTNPDEYKQAILGVKEFKNNLKKMQTENQVKSRNDLLNDFRNKVAAWQPDIIMASAMESTVSFTRELFRSVRDFGVKHVLGGVFATFAPEKAISYDEVDIICVGEGEKVIVPLCHKLATGKSLSRIPNIWVKNKDGTISKSHLSSPVDLNDNPPFDTSIFDDSRFYRAMAGNIYRMFPVETHRGCPCKCSFCNSPLQEKKYQAETGSKYFRKKSIVNVIKEVRYFAEHCKAEYLFFWADNFLSYPRDEISEFCEAYSDFNLPFYIQSYPTTIDEYKIKELVKVGLHRLGIGVEHGNEEFRKKVINRNYSNKSAIEGLAILRKYGVQYSCNNIVGFPLETPELHMDTVRLNRILQPHTASCSIFTPFHGTPLRDLAIKQGYLKDPDILAPTNNDYSILDIPTFPKDQIAGKSRTFNLYLKFPESRWKDIKKAEVMTPEGDRIWQELRQEYLGKFSNE